MPSRPLSCRRARAALLRAEGLELEQRFALEDHLDDCRDCRSLADGLLLLEDGAARLSANADQAAEVLDLDGALARLDQALESREAASPAATLPGRVLRGRRSAARLLPAAAVLLAVPALAWWWAPEDPRPEPGQGERLAQNDPAQPPIEAPEPTPLPDPTRRGPELEGEAGFVAEVGAGSTSTPALPATDAELERVARLAATERFANALHSAFRDVPPFDLEAAQDAALEAETEVPDLVDAGWPLVRLAEGLVAGDDGTAAVAARYLGQRGGLSAARRLGARRGASVPDDATLEALAALAGRGVDAGLEVLEEQLEDPRRAALTIELLGRARSASAARVLGERLVLAHADLVGEERAQRIAALQDALRESGPEAVEPLFELASLEPSDSEATRSLLQALATIDGHGPRLAARLERDPGTPVAFAAVDASADPALFPWLEQRVRSTRTRVAALQLLGTLPGPGSVDVLARLARADRIDAVALETLAGAVLAADAERVASWIDRHAAEPGPTSERRLELVALTELLLAADPRAAGPALVALTTADTLDADGRTWAALALAEGADVAAGRKLEAALAARGMPRGSLLPLAGQLLALQRLLGADGARRALERLVPERAEAVARALDESIERGSLAVGVHRVARALEQRRGAGLALHQRRN